VHYAWEMSTTIAPDPLALDRQVCFALVTTSRRVVGVYGPVLEPLGLTHPQYLVMLALWEHSPRKLVDLSRALALEPATLSPLVKRLEAAGLVTRERGVDERTLDVALTEKGRALRADAETVPPRVAAMLDMNLSELAALRGVLHRVIAAADAIPV
jgi:MarR family transcriptional regulator, organic hydroperoxide resistance regulator